MKLFGKILFLLALVIFSSRTVAKEKSIYGEDYVNYFMSHDVAILGVRSSGPMSLAVYTHILGIGDPEDIDEELWEKFKRQEQTTPETLMVIVPLKGDQLKPGDIIRTIQVYGQFDATYNDGEFLFFMDELSDGRFQYSICDVVKIDDYSLKTLDSVSESTDLENFLRRTIEPDSLRCFWNGQDDKHEK